MFRATYPDYNTVRAHIRSDRSFPMQIALSDPYRHHLHEPLLPRQGKYDATPACGFLAPFTRCCPAAAQSVGDAQIMPVAGGEAAR